jgi:hypothetical protein
LNYIQLLNYCFWFINIKYRRIYRHYLRLPKLLQYAAHGPTMNTSCIFHKLFLNTYQPHFFLYSGVNQKIFLPCFLSLKLPIENFKIVPTTSHHLNFQSFKKHIYLFSESLLSPLNNHSSRMVLLEIRYFVHSTQAIYFGSFLV